MASQPPSLRNKGFKGNQWLINQASKLFCPLFASDGRNPALVDFGDILLLTFLVQTFVHQQYVCFYLHKTPFLNQLSKLSAFDKMVVAICLLIITQTMLFLSNSHQRQPRFFLLEIMGNQR